MKKQKLGKQKAEMKSARWRRGVRISAFCFLLFAFPASLLWRAWLPGNMLANNDGPLELIHSSWFGDAAPWGSWNDLNGMGFPEPAANPLEYVLLRPLIWVLWFWITYLFFVPLWPLVSRFVREDIKGRPRERFAACAAYSFPTALLITCIIWGTK